MRVSRPAAGAAVLFGALALAVGVRWRPILSLDLKINSGWYAYASAHPRWVSAWWFVTHAGDT
jgi:hypothetical protein